MKTLHKALLITATALVVAGAALMLCAFSLAGTNMENLSTDQREWMRQTYEAPADVSATLASIECFDDSEGVRIEGYAGDTVRVEYWTHQRRNVDVRQDGGVLSVAGATSEEPFEFGVFVGASEDHATRVLVPYGFAGSLSANSASGQASVANVDNAAEVVIGSENGLVIADGLNARTLRMESDNGTVQCSVVNVADDLVATSENGAVSLDSAYAGNVSAVSVNGAVSAANATARDALSVASTNGDITLFRVDALSIETNAGNGMTRIELPGGVDDYAVSVAAENGYVSAPTSSNPDAARKVTARTENGELVIEHEDGDLSAPGVVYRGEAR